MTEVKRSVIFRLVVTVGVPMVVAGLVGLAISQLVDARRGPLASVALSVFFTFFWVGFAKRKGLFPW